MTKNKKYRPELFAKRLHGLRKKARLTQSQLADKFDVTFMCISTMERGTRFASHDLMIRLAEFFDRSIDWFYGLGDEDVEIEKRNKIKDILEGRVKIDMYPFDFILQPVLNSDEHILGYKACPVDFDVMRSEQDDPNQTYIDGIKPGETNEKREVAKS